MAAAAWGGSAARVSAGGSTPIWRRAGLLSARCPISVVARRSFTPASTQVCSRHRRPRLAANRVRGSPAAAQGRRARHSCAAPRRPSLGVRTARRSRLRRVSVARGPGSGRHLPRRRRRPTARARAEPSLRGGDALGFRGLPGQPPATSRVARAGRARSYGLRNGRGRLRRRRHSRGRRAVLRRRRASGRRRGSARGAPAVHVRSRPCRSLRSAPPASASFAISPGAPSPSAA